MRKRIGLVGWLTGGNSYGVTLPYLTFFSKFGNVEIISHTETEVRDLDLLVIPGGPDVNPSRYLGETDMLSVYTGKECPLRERFDRILLPKYVENKTKIFGICRGLQTLGVHFGAKLIQDLNESYLSHDYNPENDRAKLVHEIDINPIVAQLNVRVPLKFKVNSIHHQAIADKDLPEHITVLARNSSRFAEDRTIEAITLEPHYPIYAVQWHPEEIHDEFSVNIINNLLNGNEEV